MSKSTNRILVFVLVVLLGIYLVSNFLGGDKRRSFDPVICVVDTSAITRLEIDPKVGDPYTLDRSDEGWQVSYEDGQFPARQTSVNSILAPLTLMEADRIVATNTDRHSDFEVSDEKGTRVKVFGDGDLLADLFVGRLQFNQQARSATTYVRPADQEKVYAVNGFFSTAFNNTAEGFRQSKLAELEPAAVEEILFQQDDQVSSLVLRNDQWLVSDDMPVDSSMVADYLRSVQRLSGRNFARGVKYQDLSDPISAVEFRGAAMTDPIRIEAYRADTTQRFLLYSTLNPDNVLLSDSSGVYQKLFPPVAALLNQK